MKQYRVETFSWTGKEYTSYGEALRSYELTKDIEMGEGVDEDSYVELVCSSDGFEDTEVLMRAVPVVDEEKMKIDSPRAHGYDWDYWAKWKETKF
ncbi:hypothetical protein M3626_20830 [Psychrobacillus sp. MER TA 17]|nr:hypothetical protein [Psychrobacillus sp. MER TA 17]